MRSLTVLALVSLLALPALVQAEPVTASEVVVHVRRLVASPTALESPLLAVSLLSDRVAWRVDVDPAASVVVDARSSDASPFFLRYHPWSEKGPSSPLPGSHQSPMLSGQLARVWRVEVDPAVGVQVDIRVAFRGHLVDDEGEPWPFTLTQLPSPSCPEGSCLP